MKIFLRLIEMLAPTTKKAQKRRAKLLYRMNYVLVLDRKGH